MSIPARTRIVESYRRVLAGRWGIVGIATTEEVHASLGAEDRRELERWQRELLASDDAAVHEAFYRWMADADRFGWIHSLKWMEILAGGVWAAAVLAHVAPQGEVLDLGCNAGYWTTWFAGQHLGGVAGIDSCEAVVRFGRRRCRDAQLPVELYTGDFCAVAGDQAYDAVVSLQAFTRHFHAGALECISSVAARLRDEGYMLVVDEMPGDHANYNEGFARAGLSVRAAGMVGGQGIDREWKGYTGLVLCKDGAGGASVADADAAVEEMWKAFIDSEISESDDWTRRNSAYWWAAGAETAVDL